MFDKFKAIVAGFTGDLAEMPERKLIWLLVVTSVFGVTMVLYMIWLAYPAYDQLLGFIPGAEIIAGIFSTGIALFVYFGAGHVSGFFIEILRKVPLPHRDYNSVGAMIIGLVVVVMGIVDYYMQLRGGDVHVEALVGAQVTYNYTDHSLTDQVQVIEAQIADLETGKVAKTGWFDKGTFRLNNKGSKLKEDYTAQIMRLQEMDRQQRESALAAVNRTNQKKDQDEAEYKQTAGSSAWLIYLFMFLVGFVEAYSVESIQARLRGYQIDGDDFEGEPYAGQPAASSLATAKKGSTRTIGYQTGPKDNALQTPRAKTGECAHCGSTFDKNTTWQKYCSDACRVARWEAHNPGKKVRAPRNAS